MALLSPGGVYEVYMGSAHQPHQARTRATSSTRPMLASPISPPGDDIPHSLWSMQKYVDLSLASFSPKSDQERKGGSKDPLLPGISQLGSFQPRKSYSSWEWQCFYLVSFQHLIHN